VFGFESAGVPSGVGSIGGWLREIKGINEVEQALIVVSNERCECYEDRD